jgi:hypothetical protein
MIQQNIETPPLSPRFVLVHSRASQATLQIKGY